MDWRPYGYKASYFPEYRATHTENGTYWVKPSREGQPFWHAIVRLRTETIPQSIGHAKSRSGALRIAERYDMELTLQGGPKPRKRGIISRLPGWPRGRRK
ncbi:hypothetical protein SEA_POUND_147 [Mycobacterium phage Pound]|nr:hypothetical protein SEA_POUND_147 [Mycobacterium phage Pound]